MFLKVALSSIIWILYVNSCASKRNWELEVVSVDSFTSDPNMLNISFKVLQISRTELSVTGMLDWKFDADETTMFELLLYSSYSGNPEDYKQLPYRIHKMTLFEFFNGFYNEMIYKNVAECSNFPDFSGGFKPPLPKIPYRLERCSLTGDGFPDILPAGFYKVVFIYSGQVDGSITLVVKVLSKSSTQI